MTDPHRLPRIAIRLDGGLPPRRCGELAQAAETAGFTGVWLAENPFARGVLPAASACALMTARVRIGVGVVNPYSRHPTLIAMEWGAFDELAQGRAVLGIGAGIAAAVRQMGLGWERPLSALRDAIHIVRGMLRGETVSYRGRVFSVDGARLGYRPPRREPPIYMAAVGTRSLGLCGEAADGLIVSNMLPRGYTERAAAIVSRAATEAGRQPPQIVQYVPCVALPDRDEARRAVKPPLGAMLTAFWSVAQNWPARTAAMVGSSGIADSEFAAAIGRLRNGEAAERVLDDRFIDAFAIAGTGEECLAQAAAYGAAGVNELALNFVGDDPTANIKCFGEALGDWRCRC